MDLGRLRKILELFHLDSKECLNFFLLPKYMWYFLLSYFDVNLSKMKIDGQLC